MIENLINYIKDDDYLVGIYAGMAHIFNYKRVLDILSNEILVQVKNKKIRITGENLVIKKLDKSEMLIKGVIKRVDFIE
jgi:sporulation protein YqfC